MKTQAIHELIAARADQSPEAVALAAPGRSPLPYGELAAQIRGVGRALHGLGVGRNDAVVVVLPHGPEIVSACLGVAAHATAVPLDPRCSKDTADLAFSSVEPKAVLVGHGARSAALDIAYALGTAVVEVQSDRSAAGRIHAETATTDIGAVPLPSQAGDDAFMLPTGGAQEHLAMVSLTHHELCAAGQDLACKLGLTEGDRCLNLTPLWKWRGSVGDVIATLTAGGTLVCPPDFDSAAKFFEWVGECRPTWFTAEASVHEAILAAAGDNRDLLKHSAIRFVQTNESGLSQELQIGIENTFDAPLIERTLGV